MSRARSTERSYTAPGRPVSAHMQPSRRHSIITGVAVLVMQAAFLIALYFILH